MGNNPVKVIVPSDDVQVEGGDELTFIEGIPTTVTVIGDLKLSHEGVVPVT